MAGITFKRWFTNNHEYGKFEPIPYMDALAHVVEEYVFSDKLDMSWDSFNMVEEIRMFDFMTLAAYFICESYQEYGKTTIRGFAEELKTYSKGGNKTHVEYPKGNLFVTDASYELIMVLLGTTYIYASARYEWGKQEKWGDTASMVYDVMLEESELKKNVFRESSFSKTADSARKMMLNYMVRNEVQKGLKKEAPKEVPAADASKYEARIAELEAEVKAMKKQKEEHQIEEPAEEVKWHDKVRLELLLRLLEKSGMDLKEVVKTRVAEVMQSVTGLPISTCKCYCTYRELNVKTHEDEILKLNSKLQAIGIDILL